MIELTVGLSEFFSFYNDERPHQSLRQKTPDVVYRTAVGGGAVIIDKYHRAVDGPRTQYQKCHQKLNRGSADQLYLMLNV